MSQCPIEKLTLLEKGLIVRGLHERDELRIIYPDGMTTREVGCVYWNHGHIEIILNKRG